MLVVFCVLGLALLSFAADHQLVLERSWWEAFVEQRQGLQRTFEVLSTLGLLYAGALVVGALWSRRRSLARDLVLAAVFTAALAALLSRATSGEWPGSLLTAGAAAAKEFPEPVLALVTALLATASPQLTRPFRRLGRLVQIGVAIAAIGYPGGTIVHVVGGVLAGLLVAGSLHLLFGSPAGRPPIRRVADALADLDVDAEDVALAPRQPWGAAVYTAHDAHGALGIKVYGRDAYQAQVMVKAWRYLWYRDSGPTLSPTRLQQVEHEGFVTMLAANAGVPVADVVAAGNDRRRDAVIVTRPVGERRLSDLDASELSDDMLAAGFRAAGRLHEAGVAHGALTLDAITASADGDSIALVDFDVARVAATAEERAVDVAQLVASSALVVGDDRAIAAALQGLGADGLTAALGYLQPAALGRGLRESFRKAKHSVGDLRTAASKAVGAEVPPLQQLRRVSLRNVLMVALTAVAVWMLISTITKVDFSTLVDELQNATYWMIALAFVVGQMTNVALAVAMIGSVMEPVPLGAASVLQMAINFVNLAVPSSAGQFAMQIRFLQKRGVAVSRAVAVSGLNSVSAFAVQLVLLPLSIFLTGQRIALGGDTSSSSSPGSSANWTLIGIVVGVVAIGVAVILAVPKLRHKVLTPVIEGIRQVRDVLHSPRHLLMLFGGQAGAQIIYATCLMLSTNAYGGHVNLAQAVLVNTVASLFAGMMPVPGGMGVAEAALTAGLVAVGVPEPIALAGALTHRLITYYLPPIWGFFASRWLVHHDYL